MKSIPLTLAIALTTGAFARPVPSPALLERINGGFDVYGIVHWGLNTYTDREWGYGDEDPSRLNPASFNADQIVSACKAGGLKGLIIVAKHHDGFCLWPTKTTPHNITKSPFRGGKGDYVREMADACRKAGLKFGVYVSPWDRNNAHYGSPKYVETFHAQIKELLGGDYGEVFEMWFDGANGGDGYYGGARERRKIPGGYYRFDEVFSFVRALQPKVCIFGMDGEFAWPHNERGNVDPSKSPSDEKMFRLWEADFPLRHGWFYHARDKGKSKHAAYLMNRYLSSVGNGGTMDIGISPNKDGLLDEEDVNALKGFGTIRKAFFSKRVKKGPCNVVVLREDLEKGALINGWTVCAKGAPEPVLSGKLVGNLQIRILDREYPAESLEATVDAKTSDPGAKFKFVKFYCVDPELLTLVQTATTESGETDTAKWMTGQEKERR